MKDFTKKPTTKGKKAGVCKRPAARKETCSRPAKRNVGIICAGHALMGDDGAGIAVYDTLDAMELPYGIDAVEIGTGGMQLLHVLPVFDAAVIVDAVDFGGQPGDARIFTPAQARSLKSLGNISTHECDLLELLGISRQMGECPDDIMILGIQPQSMEPSQELSAAVRGKISGIAMMAVRTAEKMSRRRAQSAKSRAGPARC